MTWRHLPVYGGRGRLQAITRVGYFAFQELGKVLRTIVRLKYISDVDLRRFINAETDKSEQFNGHGTPNRPLCPVLYRQIRD